MAKPRDSLLPVPTEVREATASPPPLNEASLSGLIGWAFVFAVSVGWLAAVATYLGDIVGFSALGGLAPHELAAVLTGVFGPIALMWLVALMLDQRARVLRALSGPAVPRRAESAAAPLAGIGAADTGKHLKAEVDNIRLATLEAREATRDLVTIVAARTEDLRKVMQEAREARSMIGGALDALSSATRSTSDTLAGALTAIEQQLDQRLSRLTDSARSAASAAAAASADLQRQADSMLAAGDAAAEKADGATARLRQIGTDLETAANRLTTAAEEAFTAQTARIDAVDNSLARIGEVNASLDESIANARNGMLGLEDSAGGIARRLSTATDALATESERLKDLAEASQAAITMAAGSTSRAGQTVNEATDTALAKLQQTERNLRGLVTATQSELGRAVTDFAQLGETLRRSATEHSEITNAATQKATIARDQLRRVAEEIAAAGNEAASRSHAAADALRISASALSTNSDAALDKIGDVGQGFDALATRLRTAVDDAQARGGEASRIAAETARELARAGEKLKDELRGMEASIDEHARTLETAAGRAAGSIEEAGRRFDAQSANLEEETVRAVGTVDNAVKTLARQGTDVIAAADNAVQRLATVVTGFRQRADALAESATTAERRLNESTQALDGRARELVITADTAGGRVEQAADMIERRGRDLESAAERASARIDAAVGAMQRQGDIITAIADRATHETGKAGESLDEIGIAVDERIAAARAHVAEAERQLGTFAARLDAATQDTVGNLNLLIETMERDDGNLAVQAKDAISKLREMGTTIASERQALVESSAKSRDELETAIVMATKRGAELKALADETAMALGQIARNLSTETQTLSGRADEARRLMGDLVGAMRAEVESLGETAGEIELRRRNIDETDRVQRRQQAVKASAAVIEGLNGLSVDLARTLDEDVPEDVWRRYLGGEKGVFTRRLLGARSRDGHDTIAAKYREDGEFRTYVDRFMRQFDELMRLSSEVDDEDVLTATLRSSDIGKLHRLLAGALGREH
ncbi:hypothetical protein L2U69_12395 [Zavarzinia compransoris]|uniref:hypothetical protein n=1 Tax=Zavarzinia marina TaxID=2911065 RepID=UPI001F21D43E|nr:hypothetical protein [Zavarzinia marina]MCF4166445.1 hypothetical protein [Zavarzinia marina]